MSDIWEEHEDEEEGSKRELKGEWNARKSQYFNVREIRHHTVAVKVFETQKANRSQYKELQFPQEGYRDGVETGKGQTLQEGFDKGVQLQILRVSIP